jgi:hypothetical protein
MQQVLARFQQGKWSQGKKDFLTAEDEGSGRRLSVSVY